MINQSRYLSLPYYGPVGLDIAEDSQVYTFTLTDSIYLRISGFIRYKTFTLCDWFLFQKRNTAYNNFENKNKFNLSLKECRKGLWQNPTPLHDKSTREIRDTRDISQPNKGSLQ